MFDDFFGHSRESLNEALNNFIEVKGGEAERIQYPGETHVTARVVVSSGFKTALYEAETTSLQPVTHPLYHCKIQRVYLIVVFETLYVYYNQQAHDRTHLHMLP